MFARLRQSVMMLAAGALMSLSFSPFDLWPLSIACLAFLYYFINNESDCLSAHTGRQSFVPFWRKIGRSQFFKIAWFVWLFGLGFFLAGLCWLWLSLSMNGLNFFVSALAVFLFCGACALYGAFVLAFFGQIAYQFLKPVGFAGLWTLSELFRGYALTGFTWLDIGYAYAIDYSPLAGFAPVLGVYGISFLTAMLAACLIEGVTAFKKKQKKYYLVSIAVSMGILTGGVGLQLVSYTEPVGSPVTASLIQGNIPMETKWGELTLYRSQFIYWKMTLKSKGQLIIWPETGIPRYYDKLEESFLTMMISYLDQRQKSLITGITVRDADFKKNPEYRSFNSLIALGEGDVQFYHKFHLVPFGEYIPLSFRWIVDAFLPMSDFTSAHELENSPRIIYLSGLKIAPTICYENTFGEEMLEGVRQATVLINVTNLAWFGETLALEQHFQISKMRVLETQKPMLTSTNTGVTGHISASGKIIDRLENNVPGILETMVQGHQGDTPYAKYGNFPIIALTLLAIALPFWCRMRVK